MSLDQDADAVLQLRNDFATAVERRRVGGEQNHHVDVESDGIAANLHVAFFENVEQTDLDQFVQFGQFVNRKDAAMHPRNQAKVQRFFGRHADATGQLGRIDFTDDVGELGSRRQSLGVAVVSMPPLDGNVGRIVVGNEFAWQRG